MGKSSKPKQEVNEYGMSIHYGICVGPCKLKALTVKEKPLATNVEMDTVDSVIISETELFGGPKKEGGVAGTVHFLPGAADQVLPDSLAQKLGRANGADAPGYRGIASIFLTGEGYARLTGFYWSANVPYLPGIWAEVEREPIGLDADYAMIARGESAISGTVEVTWRQNSFVQPGGNDEARMGIGFTDVDGALIGSVTWSTFTQPTSWTERSVSAAAPVGAFGIRIYMGMNRLAGSNNDGYIDAISAELDGEPLALVNADAEFGATTGWVNEAGGIGVRSADPAPFEGGYYFTGGTTGSTTAYQELAFNGPDANPAHIIYECLTNTDWGMGSPATMIDTDAFNEVAQVLFGERFGLFLIWTRQSAIQDFIQEVLDHIQAVLFVDPETGLLTLKLIRADYDEEVLQEITPDNADLTSFSRKLWGEIVNEIIVTWTNPVNEEEETVVAQDLASIVTQGGIVSDSRNYYGVRYAALANQLAQRDLRSAGAPLASCEVEANRSFWRLRPASVVKVTWPEHGLEGVVFRVTNIDYGRPGDPTIKLQLVEDVFGLDIGEYIEPASGLWEDPSAAPLPLEVERVITLPMFFAADVAATPPEDADYPEVIAGILGTTSENDTFNYDVYAEVTLPDASLVWQSIGTNNVLGYAQLSADLVAEAMSAGITFSNFIGQTTPSQGGFVLIGDAGDDETEMEIAMVTDPDAVDLSRGVLDTVPKAWPAGTHVWFVDGETLFEDAIVRSAGEDVNYKLLTRTSQGLLDIGDAALLTYELTERPHLPNRPANITVGGVQFNTATTPVDMSARPDPWVTATWANRNRLTEDSLVLDWTDATVTPETDQTTTITVLKVDGTTVLATHDELTGTTFDVPDASFGTETVVIFRFSSSRTDADGTFESLQAHQLWVRVGGSERVTEAGDARVTEAGDIRVTEG